MFNGGGGFGQPGQRIIERVDEATEARSIESKANMLAKSVFLVELVLFLPWLMTYFTFGNIVILLMVEASIVVFFGACGKFAEWRARVLGKSEYSITAQFWVCLLAIVLMATFWTPIVNAFDNRMKLMFWAMGLTLYFAVPVIASRLLLTYRMGGEVVDDKPRMAISYPKIVWPWTRMPNVAHWDAEEVVETELPAPREDNGDGEWMAQTAQGKNGTGSWSFYTPPAGISNLDVWKVCEAISNNFNSVDNVYVWPGSGNIPGIGSKKHRKIQQDWQDKGYAEMRNNNNVVLLPRGMNMLGQVLSEPRPVHVRS